MGGHFHSMTITEYFLTNLEDFMKRTNIYSPINCFHQMWVECYAPLEQVLVGEGGGGTS